MTGRCVACNDKLEDYEMKINPDTNTFEDLCTRCLSMVQMDLDGLAESAMIDDSSEHSRILDLLEAPKEGYHE